MTELTELEVEVLFYKGTYLEMAASRASQEAVSVAETGIDKPAKFSLVAKQLYEEAAQCFRSLERHFMDFGELDGAAESEISAEACESAAKVAEATAKSWS